MIRWLVGVGVGVGLLLSVSAATTVDARPNQPEGFGSPVYLALGDSVAAGVGAQPYVTGYPEQSGELLAERYNTAADKATPNAATNFATVNYAVGGATTGTLLTTQLPKALQLIDVRSGDYDPFNDVEVVSVTIGGNDVFSPAVAACLSATNPYSCQPTIDTILTTIGINLTNIVQQLTAAVGPDAEIVLTTYYNPIASCFLARQYPAAPSIGDVVLEGGTIEGLLTVSAGFNDVIRNVAEKAAGVQVVDLHGQLSAGELVGGGDCQHPNFTGHTKIAALVYDVVAA